MFDINNFEKDDRNLIRFDLDDVANCTEFLEITRHIAYTIKIQEYYSVSDFLQNVSDKHLNQLLHLAEDEDDVIDEFFLVSMLLAQGEGHYVYDDDSVEAWRIVSLTKIYIVAESLKRKTRDAKGKDTLTLNYKELNYENTSHEPFVNVNPK